MMPDPKLRLNQIIDRLKENQRRITPQRMAVLKILAESEGHPSVEKIYEKVKKQFPTTSLATVYKSVAVIKVAMLMESTSKVVVNVFILFS